MSDTMEVDITKFSIYIGVVVSGFSLVEHAFGSLLVIFL